MSALGSCELMQIKCIRSEFWPFALSLSIYRIGRIGWGRAKKIRMECVCVIWQGKTRGSVIAWQLRRQNRRRKRAALAPVPIPSYLAQSATKYHEHPKVPKVSNVDPFTAFCAQSCWVTTDVLGVNNFWFFLLAHRILSLIVQVQENYDCRWFTESQYRSIIF